MIVVETKLFTFLQTSIHAKLFLYYDTLSSRLVTIIHRLHRDNVDARSCVLMQSPTLKRRGEFEVWDRKLGQSLVWVRLHGGMRIGRRREGIVRTDRKGSCGVDKIVPQEYLVRFDYFLLPCNISTTIEISLCYQTPSFFSVR